MTEDERYEKLNTWAEKSAYEARMGENATEIFRRN